MRRQRRWHFRATGLGYDLALDATIDRAAFDQWIADDLQKIEDAVDEALGEARLDAKDIDRVFLTGGTSFVPAVRAIFDQRFDPPASKPATSWNQSPTVSALIARSDDPQAWAASASR